MNNIPYKTVHRMLLTALALAIINAVAFAQDNNIVVDTDEARSWLSRNWMWVAGGVLLLIILISLGRSRTKRTTVVKDYNAGITTTTIEED